MSNGKKKTRLKKLKYRFNTLFEIVKRLTILIISQPQYFKNDTIFTQFMIHSTKLLLLLLKPLYRYRK